MWKKKLPCAEVQEVAKKMGQRCAFSIDETVEPKIEAVRSSTQLSSRCLQKQHCVLVLMLKQLSDAQKGVLRGLALSQKDSASCASAQPCKFVLMKSFH